MHRIDAAGYAAGNLFTDGNPSTGTPATVVDSAWLNGVQENIAKVIEASGITLSKGDDNQLKTAIQQLIINGGAIKAPVRAATTSNIANLAGGAPSTLDGAALAANDRVLVKDQTTGSQNGIYVVSTLGTGANGTWTRAGDADGNGEFVAGMLVVVAEGTTQADQVWELSTDGAITIGVTSLSFVRKDVALSRQIQTITASVAANALTVGLNPTSLDFRSSVLTSGAVNTRTIGSALSLTVPSSATLGTVSGQSARLVLLAIDNAGTVELAVVNQAGGNNLDETTLISTTAISAAATAANVIYSTTARTNVPFRVVGFIDITEAVAGMWATAPSAIQGGGGQALAAMASLGYGQIWQSVLGSRALSTTYYNTTGRPIMVCVSVTGTGSGTTIATAIVNGLTIQTQAESYTSSGPASTSGLTFVVPPGASYSVTGVGSGPLITLNSWTELR